MVKLLRGISENGGVIFYGINSTEIVKQAEVFHKTSAVNTAALGRLLTGAALMSATLKDRKDSLTLRVDGKGPAGLLIAVANGAGEVKGYIQNPVVELAARQDGKLNVGGAVGCCGMLSVIKDLGLKEPYIGQTPLVSGEIAEDLTSYFAVSEQIPTVCALGVLVNQDLSVNTAGGYMIQLLPGATEDEISLLERNVAKTPSVTQLFEEGKTTWQICELLLDGFNPNVLDESDIKYYCDCSEDRFERALMSLGSEELEKMLAEEPTAETVCHFCSKKYIIDIEPLLKSVKKQGK